MIKNKDQRVGVFVDVANMYHSARNLGGRLNFKAVLKEAVSDRKLIRAVAYVATSESPDEAKFFEALDKSGFELRIKELQTFASGKKKADWDVGLTVDMIRMASHLDVLILVSGDGDYVDAVEYLQNQGSLVEVVSFSKSASSKLIVRADDFLDLDSDQKKFLIRAS